MGIVFEFKECNLLINSNYLIKSKNSDYKQLLDMIQQKNSRGGRYHIYDSDFKNKDIVTRLLESKVNIISYCRNEWQYNVKKQPFVNELKNTRVCELCGYKHVKRIHHVINKHNKNKLTIGGNCAQVMLNSTVTYGAVFSDNPEAYERYINIINSNDKLRTIIQRKTEKYYQFPNFPIILPKCFLQV